MEFDDTWITKFDVDIQRPRTLKVFYFYVDKENVLQKINQDIIEIVNNTLLRDDIVKLIMRNKKKNQLINILSYIVRDVDNNTDYSSFFNEIKLENISFTDSDRIFESTNSIIFIFKELSRKLKANNTKKVRIIPSRNTRRKGLKATATEV